MPRLLAILAAVIVLACSGSPIAPIVSPAPAAVQTSTPVVKHWPVAHPDGQYGHEDPNYPPDPWQCPPGWAVEYNGWNFVCVAPVCCDREFPHPGPGPAV